MANFLSDLFTAVPALNYAKKQKKYTEQQGNIANAMIDHSNPLYQSLYGQNLDAGKQNLARTIAELSGQNRKLVGLGRNPLLDSERGGESIFRALTQGMQDAGNNANTLTMGSLKDSYGTFDNLGQRRQANDLIKSTGQSSLGSVLKHVFGL